MQIPEHWAEARVEGKVKGRKRAVRRFGWSDRSAADAMQQAEQRAAAAMAELQAGGTVPPREHKLPYGGRGLPIREQIVARSADLVVTRNSYGARCLNEPDVLFADIDHDPRLATWAERAFAHAIRGLGPIALVVAGVMFWQRRNLLGCSSLFLMLALPLAALMLAVRLRKRPRNVERSRVRTLARVRAVAGQKPGARFSLYETPAGWRLLALHRTFDPTSSDTVTLLRELGSDPAYVQMCELQACFRARVSGKPWRMNVRHIRPRPGVWPVHPDRLAVREQWIAEYEAAAVHFAACRYLEEIGEGRIDPRCAAVQRTHDQLSGARTDLPLA